MQKRKIFTVVGITAGTRCHRVQQLVLAFCAKEAIAEAEGVINDDLSESGLLDDDGAKTKLLAALVFEGEVQSAHIFPQGWGDDRCGTSKNERRVKRLSSFTVVTVDPVTLRPTANFVKHATAGNAERNLDFDFMHIADTLLGHLSPAYVYAPRATFARSSPKAARIMAMSAYSRAYLKHLDTDVPMFEPMKAR